VACRLERVHNKSQQSNGTPVTSSSLPTSGRSGLTHPNEELSTSSHLPIDTACSTSLSLHHGDINCLKSSLVAHQRSQSLSGLQGNKVISLFF